MDFSIIYCPSYYVRGYGTVKRAYPMKDMNFRDVEESQNISW